MPRAVLFDLDGTLLDIDLELFLREYFEALGPVLSELVGADGSPESALEALMSATDQMCRSHPGETNREAFDRVFAEATGIDLTAAENEERLDRFYAERFPSLKHGHGPHAATSAVIAAARAAGYRVAVATNPIFPKAAIYERIRWAGLDPEGFDWVTSYETSPACKPHAAYFRHVAESIGVAPADCIMVGDDPLLDMAAADVGMRTFYVGEGTPPCDWRGSLEDLAALLPRLAV